MEVKESPVYCILEVKELSSILYNGSKGIIQYIVKWKSRNHLVYCIMEVKESSSILYLMEVKKSPNIMYNGIKGII